MIITDPEESLKVLLEHINNARRVVCVAFQIDADPVAKQVVDALNAKNAIVYGQNELVIGHIGAKIKNLISNGSLHAKIFICDDIIINTDRNISAGYYGKDAYFESSDMIFESARIAKALRAHLKMRSDKIFMMQDGDYTMIYGNIAHQVSKILMDPKVKVASCIFMPSNRMQRILIKNNIPVVTSSSNYMGDAFGQTLEVVTRFMNIPGQTYLYTGDFHHKIIVGEDYAWHGSFNLDQVSEFYTKEQMVLTKNKDDIDALKLIVDDLFAKSKIQESKHLSYSGFIANMGLQGILNIWKALT